MKKAFSLWQYLFLFALLLVRFKSFAGACPSDGITSSINCTGDIIVNGDEAIGIYFLNDGIDPKDNNVNMIGNVTANGDHAKGIELGNYNSSSNNNTVNLTGHIMAINTGLYLFNALGDRPTENNTNNVNIIGNITVIADGARSIHLENFGPNNTNIVNMIGNITANGDSSQGVYMINWSNSSDATNVLNMVGNITANGDGAYGIYLMHLSDSIKNTNIVNMTGHILARGFDSYAIYAANFNSTNTNTVQLNRGSSVSGGIFGEGSHTENNFLRLNLGAGASYSLATTGFTVTDLNSRPMIKGSAYAAGIGNIVTASQAMYERTSQITQSLDERIKAYNTKQNISQEFWINTYYSDSNRAGQGLFGSNLSFNQYSSGITAGFSLPNRYTPTELIVNLEQGTLNIDQGNQAITSNSIMAGLLLPDVKKLFMGTFSTRFLIGFSDFNGDRKVLTNDIAYNGYRNITSSYQSTHLTIGTTWTKTLYQSDKLSLDTSVGLDLNTQHINSYSESDLFKWDRRTINQLQERAQLAIEIKPMLNPLIIYGRLGIERRDLLSGETQNFTIINHDVSYKDSNQRNTYGILNAGAYYPLTSTVRAYAQFRYYDSTKNIDSLAGSIGISGQF